VPDKTLIIKNISKNFGTTKALTDFSFEFKAGQIYGIVGENGAGKSTLVKCLAGVVKPTEGSVSVFGKDLIFGSPSDSASKGIRVAFQELSLLPNLTVAQNLMIAKLPNTIGVVNHLKNNKLSKEVFTALEVAELDPKAYVSDLSLSAKQRLEITRAIYLEPKVLILDEPTAALSDTGWLFRKVRQLRDQGVCVIYISHKLKEIEDICDSGLIMSNGQVVGDFNKTNFDSNSVISSMIGRSIDLAYPARTNPLPEEANVYLELSNINLGKKLIDVNLKVREGEIVGIAALEGQGQRELFYGIVGEGKFDAGTIKISNKEINISNPHTAMTAGSGLALVPEERKTEGIFPDLKTSTNISVGKIKWLSRFGYLSNAQEDTVVREITESVLLSKDYLNFDIGQLSGGNQQKAVIARAILNGSRGLILFDPTRGIDPAAKHDVYSTIRKLSEQGYAILLHSTELPELIGMSDRIHVLYRGSISEGFTGKNKSENQIMSYVVGHSTPLQKGANK
jgi:ribose transport system ATP-binding protein